MKCKNLDSFRVLMQFKFQYIYVYKAALSSSVHVYMFKSMLRVKVSRELRHGNTQYFVFSLPPAHVFLDPQKMLFIDG